MPPPSWRKRAADAQWVDEVAVERVAAGGSDTVSRALTYAEIMAVYDLMHRRYGTAVKGVVHRIQSHSVDPNLTSGLLDAWVRRRAKQRRTQCLEKTFSTPVAQRAVA